MLYDDDDSDRDADVPVALQKPFAIKCIRDDQQSELPPALQQGPPAAVQRPFTCVYNDNTGKDTGKTIRRYSP